MSQQSAIEWTDATWNPVTGCDRVSPGCAHCYALDLAAKLKGWGQPRYQHDGGKSSGPGFGVTLHPDKLEEPLRWRKPRRVFVNSMSDLFHEQIPEAYIARVFAVMANCPQHTFQVLTKRPERMQALLDQPPESDFWRTVWDEVAQLPNADAPAPVLLINYRFQLTNVWLGVSIENRRFVHRADVLRDTPAAVRFISAEPLLGPLISRVPCAARPDCEYCAAEGGEGYIYGSEPWSLDLEGIDWLIVGGESGPKHRRVDPQWVSDLRDQAREYGTAFFFKQWGGRTPKAGGRELDGRTWDEFPAGARP